MMREFPIYLSSGENGVFEINYDSISEYNAGPYSRNFHVEDEVNLCSYARIITKFKTMATEMG